jgi:hypothetical protein
LTRRTGTHSQAENITSAPLLFRSITVTIVFWVLLLTLAHFCTFRHARPAPEVQGTLATRDADTAEPAGRFVACR